MKLVDLKTTQSSVIKVLIEALKEIIIEVNIEFTNKYIKITQTDVSETVLINLELKAEKILQSGYYHCEYTEENPLIVGVNILHLFKLLKTLNNDDILSLYIDNINKGVLNIKLENSSKSSITKYTLNLIEINVVKYNLPEDGFDTIIVYNSTNFQKIIKDINNLQAKYIDIKSYNKQLIFSGQGDFANQETTIGEHTDDIKFNKYSPIIFQGKFLTKHLLSFTKCTNLCNNITLKLKNDFPLIISYTAGVLGKITLAIAQKNEDI
jgi:proliferating cell nuclear antigen